MEGKLQVTLTSGNISETVQHRDIVAMDD